MRTFRITLLIGFTGTAFTGCGGQQVQEFDQWVAGNDSQCSSVHFDFLTPTERIQEVLGSALIAQSSPVGQSVVQIAFVDCGYVESKNDSVFAQVLVALDPEYLPLQQVGSSRWDAYVLHISPSDSSSYRRLDDSGIAVLQSGVKLDIQPESGDLSVEGKLAFANGSVSVRAKFECRPEAFSVSRMLIGTGSTYSILFGEASGESCSTGQPEAEITGETPFLGLSLQPTEATWVNRSRWRYTVWRNVTIRRSAR